MTILRTHRGFVLDRCSSHPDGYIDIPLVEELYQRMEATNDWEHDFDYLEKVVACAKQVFFNRNNQFILTQQLRTKGTYWIHRFSLSTLEFISTGVRDTSVENFRDLMPFHPKGATVPDYEKVLRSEKLHWAFAQNPGEIISKWLAQEDGLTDLVSSLHLVAGPLPSGWHNTSEA